MEGRICQLIVLGLVSMIGQVEARDTAGVGCGKPPGRDAPADSHRQYIQCTNRGQPSGEQGPARGGPPSGGGTEGRNVGQARAYTDCVNKQRRGGKTDAQAKAACEGLRP